MVIVVSMFSKQELNKLGEECLRYGVAEYRTENNISYLIINNVMDHKELFAIRHNLNLLFSFEIDHQKSVTKIML